MRLSYSISLEDFRALQRPFALKAGANLGFKGVLIACSLIALLGGFCLWEGFGILVGGFLIGLAMVAAGTAYLYEQRSVNAKRKAYEQNLAANYQRIHCRDQRIFEADQTGLTMSCRCETVTRPWSELISFSENETHFAFGTKMGMQVIPKSGFASPAGVTELRAFVSDKLNQDKLVTSPYFDVVFTIGDYRRARFVHAIKGGGWRWWLKAIGTYVCIVLGAYLIWNSIPAGNQPVRAGIVGGLVALPLLRFARKRGGDYVGKMRLSFSQEGLHAQYPARQSRWPWSQFIGYLEDDKVLLLYLNPKLYTVIPQPGPGGSAAQLKALVAARLPRFDYRNPNAAPATKASASAQQSG
jgi:hypothetical protein